MSLIKDAKPSAVGTADLYRCLAHKLVACPPPQAQRIPFLNAAWNAITKVGDPVAYAKYVSSDM
jgi:hypothetical protein